MPTTGVQSVSMIPFFFYAWYKHHCLQDLLANFYLVPKEVLARQDRPLSEVTLHS